MPPRCSPSCASTRSGSPSWRRRTRAVRRRRRAAISARSPRGKPRPSSSRRSSRSNPGQLCAEPVATRYGFHIIRLDRKHEGRTLPFELVADRIADYLRESVRRRADAQYIARLVSAARIEGVELAGADALRVH